MWEEMLKKGVDSPLRSEDTLSFRFGSEYIERG